MIIPRKEVFAMEMTVSPPPPSPPPPPPPPAAISTHSKQIKLLEDLFHGYGIRTATIVKFMEMGFTFNTLVNMVEPEIDDVIKTMVEVYQMELLIGERYGVKSAIRAERKRKYEEMERQRLKILGITDGLEHRLEDNNGTFMALADVNGEQRGDSGTMLVDAITTSSQSNLNSWEHAQQEHSQGQLGTPGLSAIQEPSSDNEGRTASVRKRQKRRLSLREPGENGDDRAREHPFIVTEPGEVARGKKNGLDYLFDLYEQCGRFLDEVQLMAREKGEKCPTKVTNQVFRHAKLKGVSYINKPKMRHYVHCYALHCLDKEKSNNLRKLYKERGESVGAWRQACYYPLVEMARANGWDTEGVFIRNEKLRIWYVPSKLRQLCHLEKSKDSKML